MIRKKKLITYPLLFILASIWFINYLIYKNNQNNHIRLRNDVANDNRWSSNSTFIASFRSKIERPKYNVSCRAIFELNMVEIERAKTKLNELKISKKSVALLKDENFIFSKAMCPLYKKLRYAGLKNEAAGDLDMSFAYSILVYNNVEQFERLLRLIYKRSNVYCVHVDVKASATVKKAINSIVDCFDNVFVATQLEYIVYAGFSRLKADLNCLNDMLNLTQLVNRHENLMNKRVIEWKYINNLFYISPSRIFN